MIKKILGIIILIAIFLFSIQSSFALQTYVGVKILNLSDSTDASCNGVAGYGSQGRMRALSSIQPEYPIYFNLTYINGTAIWSGNDTQDKDYAVNDIIYLPQQVDLQIGQQYKLFFDIDAIRIYLPLPSLDNFVGTSDDNYWTGGYFASAVVSSSEYHFYSDAACSYSGNAGGSASGYLVSNNRSILFHSACNDDAITYNCDNYGLIRAYGVSTKSTQDFLINDKYNTLYLSNVGNFEFGFTFS